MRNNAIAPTPADPGAKELTIRFETGTLPDGDFTHRDHVRVAWELLRRYPLGLAIQRMTDGIQALAEQHEQPGLYHGTITSFYLLAIADARAHAPEAQTFAEFEERHPSIVGKSRQFLLGFYSTETLDSPGARRGFLLPERLPHLVTPGLRSSS